ncbi:MULTISPECIES: hypothetical protein [Delftia]|jgi:hypothetical protein|uniref:hypothetical protein n=1 Tax=Delftia TaxID=80865 RepID=UPI000F8249D2|nr:MULTISPECIES: hypothetical protein [Delftia]MDH0771857.1 hypothetical protein [Delftia tsuruhatensis]MDH0847070.1 hypothetical protein [Delftia tsuruhatensis]MDH1456624.1 hypothetical protein [Delftia tsuruhatensis]MDH1822642.1 hypothetical protein [Delftia tsuruhatensis]TDF27963.1 hypothetical protein EZI45_14750 [Delftia tsuruhatensis]
MNQRMLAALCIAALYTSSLAENVPKFQRIVVNFNLSEKLAACYPELATLQAYDSLPFPQASEQVARIASLSRNVTPLIFPPDRKIFAPNKYAIHSISCADGFSGICHYLSVMPTLGLPQYRMYGPLNMSCTPVIDLQTGLE